MKMKKLIALLLVLVMALSCAACDKDEEKSDSGRKTKSYTAGEVKGDTYTNEYFEIECTLPDEWFYFSDEQIAKVQGYSQEMVGEGYAKILEQTGSAMEMYASEENTGMYTLNCLVEKIDSKKYTEKKYIEDSLSTIKTMLGSAGFDVTVCEVVTVDFAGEEHYGLRIEGSLSGASLYEQLVVMIEGDYLACITACSYVDDYTDDILDFFTAI